MKVGGTAAPLVEDPMSQQRAGHCKIFAQFVQLESLLMTFCSSCRPDPRDSELFELYRPTYTDFVEQMDAKLPPTSKQVSGILAIQIHQMADLELSRPSMRKGAAGTHTPSTYAQIVGCLLIA